MRAICFLVVAGCVSWPAPEPEKARPLDGAGVVQVDEQSIRFLADAGGKPVVERTRHVRARILHPAGTSLARVAVFYSPAFSEVVSLRARTIALDGSKRSFGMRDAADLPAYPRWMLYSDQRALVLELQPQTPGTIVEYEYVTRHQDWRFTSFEQGFGDEFPEQLVRLSVSAPAGWEVEHLARRLNETVSFPPSVETVEGRTRWTWVERDLPPLPSEPLAPAPSLLATVVSVRLAAWSEHGKSERAPRDSRELSSWLYQNFVARETGEQVGQRARELVKGLAGDAPRCARILYEWVRDNVAYCAVSIGVGGWRPHAASDVLKLQYGDCKDKANLLRTMLEAVDVPSRAVALFFHDGYPRRFALATAGGNFNHEILAVDLPGGVVLADPTSRTTPFGALPLGDQEADLLPISATGDAIMAAPASAAADNREELTFELSPRGADLEGSFTLSRMGAPAEELRRRLIETPAAARWKPVGESLQLTGWRLSDLRLEGVDAPDLPTPLKASGRVTLHSVLAPSTTQLLRLSDLIGASVPSLPAGKRRAPLVLRGRKHLVHRFTITLPAELEASIPVGPAEVVSPFGHYQLSRRKDGNRLVMERSLSLSEHVFPAEAYPKVKAFFDEILAAEAAPLTLRPRRPE